MAERKMYQAPGIDIEAMLVGLDQWLQNQGYETQTLPSPGGLTLQGRQTKSWVQRQGVALNIQVTKQADNLGVEIGTGKWVVQAVSGVAALIIFWPLMAIPAYVAYKQKQIIDDAWDWVNQYIGSGGQMGVFGAASVTGMSATPPTPVETASCPKCGADVDPEAKFCNNCGAKLTLECAECGATLRADAKFCDACGAKVEAE